MELYLTKWRLDRILPREEPEYKYILSSSMQMAWTQISGYVACHTLNPMVTGITMENWWYVNRGTPVGDRQISYEDAIKLAEM